MGDDLGAELQDAAEAALALHHLHALARGDQLPLGAVGLRVELVQRVDLLVPGLQHLGHEVLGQVHVVLGHVQHRAEVVRAHGQRQVQVGTGLEEVRGEPGVGAEQQGPLAVHEAGVQVGHGHRRGADGGLAVHLGHVLVDHGLVRAAQELAGDGEAAEALGLGDAGLLQQGQGAAAGTDEDEAGAVHELGAGGLVLDLDLPAAVRAAGEAGDLVTEAHLGAGAGHGRDELAGEGAEVHVGAAGVAGRRQALARLTALDQQRGPGADLLRVLAVLHAGEQRLGGHGLVAGAEVVRVVVTPHEGHVRQRVDEGLGVLERAVRHQGGPELAGGPELLVDAQRLGDVHPAVLVHGRVVQLAEGGVAGARVVPRVGGLQAGLVEALVQGDGPGGLELLQQHAQGGAHDAAADQDDVVGGGGRGGGHGQLLKQNDGGWAQCDQAEQRRSGRAP